MLGWNGQWTHTFLGHWNLMINLHGWVGTFSSFWILQNVLCSQCHTQRNSQWFSTGDTILKSRTLKSGSLERIRYWNRGISGFSKFIQILIVFIPFSETTSYQVAKFPTIRELVRNSNKTMSEISIVVMLLISHQGQKPKSSDLAAQRFQIGIHGMQTCKLANLPHFCVTLPHCLDLRLLLLFQGLEIWGNPWWFSKRMAPLLSSKSKVMAPSTKGNTVSTPWTQKSASLKKANPTDQSSWLVFDRAIS